MSIFDANDDRGIKVAPSQKQLHGVYVMVYHQTLSIEEALELAREIERVAGNQEQARVRARLEQGPAARCKRCGSALEDCYCVGGPR